jgi:hypothetical protein
VVKAAREAGATGVWTNLLFLRPGTREHFLEHLAEDWPEQLELYLDLYKGRAYLQSAETKALRQQVAALAREFDVRDRRANPLTARSMTSSWPWPSRRLAARNPAPSLQSVSRGFRPQRRRPQ